MILGIVNFETNFDKMKTKRKRSASPVPSTSGRTSNASHDALNVESNASQQSQIGQTEGWIQCKGCPKKIQEKSILLHLRSKKCKQRYSDKEYSDLLAKRDEVRRGYEVQRKKVKSNPKLNVPTMPESIEPTNSCPNQSQQNQPDPAENWIQCKGCPKKMLEKSILLHLRSKTCRKHYNDIKYSKLIAERDERNDAKKNVYLKQYNKNNKEALKEKRQENAKKTKGEKSFKEAEKNRQRQWRAKNKEALKKKRQDNAKAIKESEKARQHDSRSKKRKSVIWQGRVLAFKRDVIDGPNIVCFSCNRCLFKSSIRILKENDIAKLVAKISADIIIEAGLEAHINNTDLIVCHGCFNSLSKNRFPSLNVNNGLKVDQVPDELSCISDLEQQLIARSLIFMKMKKLPISRMGAVVDQVISVPIEQTDVVKNVSKLPRHPSDAHIVAVKLKRKLEYKTAVLEEFIRPKNVIRALEILKECGNEYYQHINVDKDFMVTNTAEKRGNDEDENVDIEVDNQSIISEESEDESEDPVKKYQSKQSSHTCLTLMLRLSQIILMKPSQSLEEKAEAALKLLLGRTR